MYKSLIQHPWFDIWLWVYAIGLILLPPFQIGSKKIFAAEWMLLAPIIIFLSWIPKGKIKFLPKELFWVWLAILAAFISGLWRDNLALEFSQYNQDLKEDQFSMTQDGIRFFRWMLIFSTPWILQPFLTRQNTWLIFWKALKWCVLISAILAIQQVYGGWIPLGSIYNYQDWRDVWQGRAYGTFQSPLDAGLVYGACFIITLLQLKHQKNKGLILDIILSLIFLAALILTHSATAFLACLLTLLYFGTTALSRQQRNILFFSLALLILFVSLFTPEFFWQQKLSHFMVRQETWLSWLTAIPSHPHILLTGMGFTYLVIDNSFFLLLINGGLFFFITSFMWLKKLLKNLPTPIYFFMIFWMISWLALDSIGYWGIGRIAWAFLGITKKT